MQDVHPTRSCHDPSRSQPGHGPPVVPPGLFSYLPKSEGLVVLLGRPQFLSSLTNPDVRKPQRGTDDPLPPSSTVLDDRRSWTGSSTKRTTPRRSQWESRNCRRV